VREDSVTDEYVGGSIGNGVKSLTGDCRELDIVHAGRSKRLLRPLEHRWRDVQGNHPVEATGQEGCHPAMAAADLDAHAASRVGTEALEQAVELLPALCGFADVELVAGRGECVPGRSDLRIRQRSDRLPRTAGTHVSATGRQQRCPGRSESAGSWLNGQAVQLAQIGSTSATAGLTFETISSEAGFAALAEAWDELVRAMPRPSPFLLHGWLLEWWRHYGAGAVLAVHVARRDGRLVAALPLVVRRRLGVQVAEFIGAGQSALADLMLAAGEEAAVAESLAERVASSGYDLADLFGLPGESRLAAALGPERLRLIERIEAPVLDLSAGWEAVYREKTSSKRRNQNRRRRRQLGELGRLEVEVARTREELGPALEEAFRLHALRWEGRPDGSGFVTPTGVRFHRAALQALADRDVLRIVTLKLDGRAIAFHYFFLLAGRMYVHRLAFDPALSHFSPGIVNTLDAIDAAAGEGVTRVEFLGGAERYKLELADRLEPLYEGLGLAASPRGDAVVGLRLASIRLRRQLKRSPAVRRLYFEGLAPARRLAKQIGRAPRH
jgi:CelD/BcsL family acetyltransferase involved in cellulose biosynthesis